MKSITFPELTMDHQSLDQDEALEILEWPHEKAIAQIQDGTLRDAKTIIGLQMVYVQERKEKVRQ